MEMSPHGGQSESQKIIMTNLDIIKIALITGAILAGGLQVSAQYDQNINVEGKYVPEYINHDRLGLFPEPIKFPAQESELNYSLTGVNADFEPQLVPLQATGWKSTRAYSATKGYLDLALGSWLRGTLSAGYRFVDTGDTQAGVRFQHNSTTLWKPEVSVAAKENRMWRYDESLGVYAAHTFGNAGRLDASLDYHIGNFNYYGYIFPEAPTQTLNDAAFKAAWHSRAGRDILTWHVGADVRYFGYRSLYLPDATSSAGKAQSVQGSRETTASLDADITFPLSSSSALGLEAEGEIVAYAKPDGSESALTPAIAPDNYGMVTLTPFYRFVHRRININIGARMDFAFRAGEANDRYSTFHIAPEVRLDYNAGPMSLYLDATGGSRLNTLAANYERDYYQTPAVCSSRPEYTPLDAKLGVSFGPFSGFYAGFEFSYRTTRGLHNGGWYMPMLNCESEDAGYDLLPAEIDGHPVEYDFNPAIGYDIGGFSFGVKLGYDAGKYFRIDASTSYQKQSGDTGFFNGYDRPEYTAQIRAVTNPWGRLKFSVGYSLRAMRKMAVAAYRADESKLNGPFITDFRLPNTSELSFSASYGITDNFDLSLQADNLLNRKTLYLPGLPTPGISISGGISLRF